MTMMSERQISIGEAQTTQGTSVILVQSGHKRCVNQHMWHAQWPAPTGAHVSCLS